MTLYRSTLQTTITLIIVASFVGCAAHTKPVLYPNDFLSSQTKTQVDADISDCMALADDYVKDPNRYQELAKTGLTSGAIGAGAGALGGVIMGSNVGRSVGAGAAVGAVVAIAHELLSKGDHSPTYQSFVNQCLSKRGYEVTGWN